MKLESKCQYFFHSFHFHMSPTKWPPPSSGCVASSVHSFLNARLVGLIASYESMNNIKLEWFMVCMKWALTLVTWQYECMTYEIMSSINGFKDGDGDGWRSLNLLVVGRREVKMILQRYLSNWFRIGIVNTSSESGLGLVPHNRNDDKTTSV